jgi:RimJ/RimL family protein N-acetyltransferase
MKSLFLYIVIAFFSVSSVAVAKKGKKAGKCRLKVGKAQGWSQGDRQPLEGPWSLEGVNVVFKSSELSAKEVERLYSDPLIHEMYFGMKRPPTGVDIRLMSSAAEQGWIKTRKETAIDVPLFNKANEWIGIFGAVVEAGSPNKMQVGLGLFPEFRGEGYARQVVKEFAHFIKTQRPEINTLVARILPENTASQRLFQSMAFEFREEGRDGYLIFERSFNR